MEWFKKFMTGRYGVDQLSVAILILSLCLSFLDLFINNFFFSVLIIFPLGICYYRIFSKNISARQQENFRFLRYWYPLQKRFKQQINYFKGLKTHKYYKCPQCHQKLRVPRGKGSIRITCPKCKTEFKKTT